PHQERHRTSHPDSKRRYLFRRQKSILTLSVNCRISAFALETKAVRRFSAIAPLDILLHDSVTLRMNRSLRPDAKFCGLGSQVACRKEYLRIRTGSSPAYRP